MGHQLLKPLEKTIQFQHPLGVRIAKKNSSLVLLELGQLLALDECQGLVGNYDLHSLLEKYIDVSKSMDLIRERHGRVPESADWVGGVGTCIREGGKEKGGVVFAARSAANFDDLRSDCNESFMVEILHIIAEVWSLVIEVRSMNDRLASPFVKGLKDRVKPW